MPIHLDLRRAPITLILATIIVGIEVVCMLDELVAGDDATRRVALWNNGLAIWWTTLWKGYVWEPMTNALLHGNLIHAAFNTYWLLVFGQFLEERFRPALFSLITIGLAYTSGLLDFTIANFEFLGYNEYCPALFAWLPRQEACGISIGFSGVVYGYFGIMLTARKFDPDAHRICDQRVVNLLIFWLFFCIFLTYAKIMPVANIAHFVGFGVGWLYGQALYDTQHRKAYLAAAIALTLAVMSIMLFKPPFIVYCEHLQVI